MGFELLRPATVPQAVALASAAAPGELAVLAGGTDLLLDVDRGLVAPRRVLSLARLPWHSHRWAKGGLTVGSAEPLRNLELDPRLARRLPGLHDAIRAVGSVALRERATLGGNVVRAAPASDLLPILLAYDAVVDVVGPEGRRSVALDALLARSREPALGHGELVASVAIPTTADSVYRWQRVRPANDVSQVGVAVVRSTERPYWRVALGGVPSRPLRLHDVERELARARPTREELGRAAAVAGASAPFVSDKRASEPYRRRVVALLLTRSVEQLLARATPKAG